MTKLFPLVWALVSVYIFEIMAPVVFVNSEQCQQRIIHITVRSRKGESISSRNGGEKWKGVIEKKMRKKENVTQRM